MATDLRVLLRGFVRSPGFTALAVISLALGIGLNTAVFSLINALFWQSIRGVPAPHRVVLGPRVSGVELARLREGATTLEGLAGVARVPVQIVGRRAEPGGGRAGGVRGLLLCAARDPAPRSTLRCDAGAARRRHPHRRPRSSLLARPDEERPGRDRPRRHDQRSPVHRRRRRPGGVPRRRSRASAAVGAARGVAGADRRAVRPDGSGARGSGPDRAAARRSIARRCDGGAEPAAAASRAARRWRRRRVAHAPPHPLGRPRELDRRAVTREARRVPAGHGGPARDRGGAAVDRLLERRQPAAGARRRPAPRDRDPAGHRRQPPAHRAAPARRDAAARARGRRARRAGRRVDAGRRLRHLQPVRHDRRVARRGGARLHRGRVVPGDGAGRSRARARGLARRRFVGPEGRGHQPHRERPRRPPARGVPDRPGRLRAGAADGRRHLRAQPGRVAFRRRARPASITSRSRR